MWVLYEIRGDTKVQEIVFVRHSSLEMLTKSKPFCKTGYDMPKLVSYFCFSKCETISVHNRLNAKQMALIILPRFID